MKSSIVSGAIMHFHVGAARQMIKGAAESVIGPNGKADEPREPHAGLSLRRCDRLRSNPARRFAGSSCGESWWRWMAVEQVNRWQRTCEHRPDNISQICHSIAHAGHMQIPRKTHGDFGVTYSGRTVSTQDKRIINTTPMLSLYPPELEVAGSNPAGHTSRPVRDQVFTAPGSDRAGQIGCERS
jgi:hypothetical protein